MCISTFTRHWLFGKLSFFRISIYLHYLLCVQIHHSNRYLSINAARSSTCVRWFILEYRRLCRVAFPTLKYLISISCLLFPSLSSWCRWKKKSLYYHFKYLNVHTIELWMRYIKGTARVAVTVFVIVQVAYYNYQFIVEHRQAAHVEIRHLIFSNWMDSASVSRSFTAKLESKLGV